MVTNVDFWKAFEETEESCNKRCDECPVWWDSHHVCLHESIANWETWNVEERQRREKLFKEEEEWDTNVSTV